jgi:large subunit ribosomal protein L21
MYAIVKVGGKQYRVEKGDSLVVDRLRDDEGSKVALEPLLYRSKDDAAFDRDSLRKVKVEAVVTGHERGEKVHVLKFKPKRGYKRRLGHRSNLTRLEIKNITMLSRKPATKKAETAGTGPARERSGARRGRSASKGQSSASKAQGSGAKAQGSSAKARGSGKRRSAGAKAQGSASKRRSSASQRGGATKGGGGAKGGGAKGGGASKKKETGDGS